MPGDHPRAPAPAVALWLAIALWLAAMVAAALKSTAALSRPLRDRLADLQVYVGSADLLRDGGSLYDFAAPDTGAPFTYPPVAGLAFLPMTLIDPDSLAIGWTVATVAAVALIAVVAARSDGPHQVLPPPSAPAAIAAVLFVSAPVISNLRFGQISVFLTLLVLIDCGKLAPPRLAGVATGLAAAVKLTPLIFIPHLWLAGERRAAATAAGTFGAFTVAGWLLLPGESVRFWLTEIWNVDRVGNIATNGNQSINGVLLRLAAPDGARTAVLATIGLAVVVIALIRAAVAHRNGHPLAGAVIVGAAGLAFSPVSWTHHQTWLVLAALLAVEGQRAWSLAWTALVVSLMVVPITSMSADLPGGELIVNARSLLAVAVACVVPFRALRPPATDVPSPPLRRNRPAPVDQGFTRRSRTYQGGSEIQSRG